MLDNQQASWTQGGRPLVESYQQQHPWLNDDSESLLDLIDHEVVLRTEAGEQPTLDEYVRRFPGLKEPLAIQFALHESLLPSKHLPAECFPTVEILRNAPQLDTAETALPSVPRRVGPYQLLKPIGSGGMGEVYLAEDTILRRHVALKVLLPNIAANSHARARFLREAQAAATIDHENVISVYQVGEADEAPFIAMPLLQGETLQDRLQREHTIPWQETLRIGRDVCRGLAAAHRRGLLHRDIKPSNLWLDRERDRTVILDFGLAQVADCDQKLTSDGTVLGTPSYMSPEQVTANPLGPQTDLFSLGVVLYQAMTGKIPFQGAHILATLSALANQRPSPPHVLNPAVPTEFSDCVMSLLAKEPSQRPGSAEELLAKLEALAECRTTTLIADPRTGQPTLPTRRKVIHRGVVLVALLSVLGGAAWLAATVFTIETPDGVLTVQTDVDDIKLVVERGGKIVRIIDPRRQRTYRLKPGKYQVRLEEKRDGVVLETSAFILKRDGQQIVNVKYEPKSVAASARTADRAAAEWVLSQGGRVHVRELGRAELIETRPGGTLPNTAFQLVRVEFVGQRRVTDDDLARFKDLAALEDLRLEGTNVRGRGLRLLGNVKSLRHLSLPSTPFGDDDVEHLAAVPELTELWLGETAVTDIGLERLCQLLPHLVYLRLERTKVTGAGLKHLQALKQLKNLVLIGVPLKDEDVSPLAKLPALLWLDLRMTPVTDRTLDELVGLQSLRGLAVYQTGVTTEGIRRFSQRRPECKVSFEENRGAF